ncbi:MAG TPA: AmmeMemoRadiSam system protein B [Thermoanaerobaculia bacterium]|nr:AmmeMemoRadiSam system protein B [Thermoanaerobaculia bacterium]
MPTVRQPAVAGQFYPADPRALERAVQSHLDALEGSGAGTAPAPTVLIVPHAGYEYSGPIAASAFSRLTASAIGGGGGRVVLIGPSHYAAFDGLALSGADVFATPLGPVAVDRGAEALLSRLPQVATLPAVHAPEHALEVELPFLQRLLRTFELVPVLVGDAEPSLIAEALDLLLRDEGALLVVSSDLSHFLDYDSARRCDRATASRIEAREAIASDDACGWVALNGLAAWLRDRGVEAPHLLDLRSSGDTGGPRASVVGYGAFAG